MAMFTLHTENYDNIVLESQTELKIILMRRVEPAMPSNCKHMASLWQKHS